MPNLNEISIYIAGFLLIALASNQLGNYFTRFKLPLISGFLFTGILAGPYALQLIPAGAIENLRFIDEIALAVIAFAAGNELYIKELRDRFKSISWIITGQIIFTFPLNVIAILLLADYLPFMQSMTFVSRLAVAILGGAILVARSPSSAIAIINELRARGAFTKTVLGVTMLMDVVVIVLFGVNSSIADALLTNIPFSSGFIGLLLLEITLSLGIGYLLFRILQFVLATHQNKTVKTLLVLALGYAVFWGSAWLRTYTHEHLAFEILVEPLLICMISGFLISSFSPYRDDFARILEYISPAIYILFFTLTGASLALDILVKTWPIALALFGARLTGIFIGSFSGGMIAKDSHQHNRLAWMAYVTQAGVGLGLAKEVAAEFPGWGDAFATTIIAVIVLNQIVGPPLFKWVINRVGEAHPRGETADFDGVQDAIILGLKASSINLARQLIKHGWQVKLACTKQKEIENCDTADLDIHLVSDYSAETLRQLDIEHADAVISFLSDKKAYAALEIIYEQFGTKTLVANLQECADYERFRKLGVLVVERRTAVISLLEHYVRAPVGTSLLLGQGDGQDMIDLEVRSPNIAGLTVREMRLPLDVLILSIQRDGHTLITRGFTQLQIGDLVTMLGPAEKLEEVMLRFDG